ncbi:MAG: Hsp70 family protein [Endomicrobium sp.]|jgi:molecular chaperone DnaK (HSP70)|nr:Hsp70 family protein [Endomicrobium sp.]
MVNIYGIDLGTTYSMIGLRDNLLSGLVPSIANVNTKLAGEKLLNDEKAKRSFKVNMSLGKEGNISIYASALVLRELKTIAGGDSVTDVIISVPAYFSDNQRQATLKAASLVKLKVHALINEPTAAAIYIGQNRKSLFVVYDLGGGTFDVSIVDGRFGYYDVQASDGCILGGDNLDILILKYLVKAASISRHRLTERDRFRLAMLARDVKHAIQKTRMDITVDLTGYGAGEINFTEDIYIDLMKMCFADTVSKTKQVIHEYIPEGDDYDVVLVGGSIRCPYLQKWITEEIKAPLEIKYNPDEAVARGVSLYADMFSKNLSAKMLSDVTKALSVELSDGTVQRVIDSNSKIPTEESLLLVNDRDSDKICVNLYQGDSILAKDNECIGQLIYSFTDQKRAGEGEVIVTVTVENNGLILVKCKELLGQEQSITLDRTTVSI